MFRKTLRILALLTAIALAIGAAFSGKVVAFFQHDHKDANPAKTAVQTKERKVLYWYDAMNPQRTYDKPGKAPDGMDLVPKYAGDEPAATSNIAVGTVTIPPEKQQVMMRSLLNKHILLFERDDTLPFWLSDNPVTKNNTLNPGDGVVGTLGLEVPGIEVYLPISSQITVAFMSPLITAAYEEVDARARRMGFIRLGAHEYLRALRSGRPMKLNRENVRFQNSLQAHNAERWIFSCEDSFEDAIRMVEGGIVGGPRITMN